MNVAALSSRNVLYDCRVTLSGRSMPAPMVKRLGGVCLGPGKRLKNKSGSQDPIDPTAF
jgi:hypothetical protein